MHVRRQTSRAARPGPGRRAAGRTQSAAHLRAYASSASAMGSWAGSQAGLALCQACSARRRSVAQQRRRRCCAAQVRCASCSPSPTASSVRRRTSACFSLLCFTYTQKGGGQERLSTAGRHDAALTGEALG
jgi:hypothetical protein